MGNFFTLRRLFVVMFLRGKSAPRAGFLEQLAILEQIVKNESGNVCLQALSQALKDEVESPLEIIFKDLLRGMAHPLKLELEKELQKTDEKILSCALCDAIGLIWIRATHGTHTREKFNRDFWDYI